jgi:hypothetical protein
LPIVRKGSNVVDVDINFVKVAEDVFHDFLRYVWRLRYAHWKAVVPVVTKRRADGAQLFARLVLFKGIVLHGNIQLAKESIA